MINVFIKQTTSVESQRISQLVGSLNGAEFDRVVRELYTLFFKEGSEESLDDSVYSLRQIEITVVSANNLPKTDVIGSVDAYCEVFCDGVMHRTVVMTRNYHPTWNQTFVFTLKQEKNKIQIVVLDSDVFSNSIIGSIVISEEILAQVFINSSEQITELETQLMHNGRHIYNADGSPSMLKIRLKKAGLVVSGCDLSELKKFFLSYDTNGDGEISESEFISMMRQISTVSKLFTGTEDGDTILKSLSQEQVLALLRHKWVIPDREQKSPMESIISNIRIQNELQSTSNRDGVSQVPGSASEGGGGGASEVLTR